MGDFVIFDNQRKCTEDEKRKKNLLHRSCLSLTCCYECATSVCQERIMQAWME